MLAEFSNMKTLSFAVNSHAIRRDMMNLINSDTDSMITDYRTRSYYLKRKPFVWINRHGVDHRADSLVVYLRNVDKMGFSRSKFRVSIIERDLQRLRNLDFGDGDDDANYILARLEYNLTKAYLRYVTGQRFGFVNPEYVFNRLDVKDKDSTHVSYRGLFDVDMQLPGTNFYKSAFHKIYNDSVGEFLHEEQPTSPLYYRFLSFLNNGKATKAEKVKILCNMERCRWRLKDYPEMHKKYVLVNIPSFRLLAKDGDDSLWMRIGCGTFDTKTPMLTSQIKRMDINPQWIIPRSIIKKDVIRHIGNKHYFDSHHFFVRERSTGKKVDIYRVSSSMLESKDYLVIQEGGQCNSLGRIIFRFDNDFSVFLHDTSSKEIFSRDTRGVSHGCVRVEKPFELAVFMLKDKDEQIVDKIKYSMNANVSNMDKHDEEKNEFVDTLDRSKLIGSLPVIPRVPLFITYFTLYPIWNGKMGEYDDVYGYDHVIYNCLCNYL